MIIDYLHSVLSESIIHNIKLVRDFANNSKKLWQDLNSLCSFTKSSRKINLNINKMIYKNKEFNETSDTVFATA